MRIAVFIAALFLAQGVALADGHNTTPAQLMPTKEVTLSTQISGKINKLPVKEGDRFKKGDTLVAFDCKVYRAQLAKANAKVVEARQLHNANVRLAKYGSASKVQVAKSRSELHQAIAEQKIKSHLVAQCNVKAPFGGAVIKHHVNEHQNVNNGDALIEILDAHHLRIEMIVPSHWLMWLKVGSPFEIAISETGKSYQAKVTKILPRIDSVSQTVRIFAEFTGNAKDLLAGMSGQARFAIKKTAPSISAPVKNGQPQH